jgi:mono/diheme cytochrome c family protein
MRPVLALALLIMVTACNKVPEALKAPAGPGGPPPPFLLYQMRAEAPPGDSLTAGRDGAALFSNRCGYCHLIGGMGTNLLTKQRIAAGRPPETALLVNRTDLQPDYIKSVVRMGKGAMPHQTKVDVTDAELDSIAAYLAKAKP